MPDTRPTATKGVSWPGAERYDTETFLTTFTLNHQYERFNGFLKAYWNETDFDLLQELTNGRRYGAEPVDSGPDRRFCFTEFGAKKNSFFGRAEKFCWAPTSI